MLAFYLIIIFFRNISNKIKDKDPIQKIILQNFSCLQSSSLVILGIHFRNSVC